LALLCSALLSRLLGESLLGWDAGLLRAAQKEQSPMKEQINIKGIHNLLEYIIIFEYIYFI
jgi:hypothetical protein